MKSLMSVVMPSCREVTRLIASEEEASLWRRTTVRLHLSMCEHCSRFARHLRLISESLRSLWSPPSAGDVEELERRVLARLRTP